MQRIVSWVLIAALVLVGVRFTLISFDDAALQNEVSGVPSSLAAKENDAQSIASLIRTRAQQAKCEVAQDGIEVDLAQPVIRGQPPHDQAWQMVTMQLHCRRRNALFQMRMLDVKVALEMMVPSGHADHWP